MPTNISDDVMRFAISAFGTALALTTPAETKASEFEQMDNNISVVLTPSRLRQSLTDVPASVTVITAEMIKHFAIRSIPDALRMAPGMAITQVSGNDFRINFTAPTHLFPGV